MHRHRPFWTAVLGGALALVLTACGGGGGGGSEPSEASTGAIRTLSVPSAQVGVTYEVTVYTPPGYATSTGTKAVIYAPDHELQFQVIREAVESNALDAIIVSVGNLGAARRFVDFDLPGADAYYRFLTLELVPLVEAQYRVDPARRTLMGYSLSGLFAVIALMDDNPTGRFFSGYVITDPSLQFNTTVLFAREQQMFDASRRLPIVVHACSTAGGYPYATFHETLAGHGYESLRYQFRIYPLSHAAVLRPCIEDGLRYVFGRG